MNWKIYLLGGSTVDSDQGIPSSISIPNRYGVVCIQQLEPYLNREILNRWPLYRWDPDSNLWFGTTRDGVFDRLLARPPEPVPVLLRGVDISRTTFDSFYIEVLNDPAFSAVPKTYDNWESPRYSNESKLV
jgi:hypothetical protein